MTTVRKLVTSSLRLLNVVQAGVAPSPDDIDISVKALTVMIDSWSTDRLAIHKMAPYYFNLQSGQQSYTMGPGGDFDISRPMRIERAYLSFNASQAIIDGENVITLGPSTNDFPITIVDVGDWANIAMKDVVVGFQTKMYDNGDYPLRTLSFWPVPATNAVITLWLWQPLINTNDLDAEVIFPPGYERAIKFNLAVELAAEFGKSLTQEMMTAAGDSWAKIKRLNSRPGYIKSFRV